MKVKGSKCKIWAPIQVHILHRDQISAVYVCQGSICGLTHTMLALIQESMAA